MEKPENNNKDYLWWGISAMTGALLWSLPNLMHSGGKEVGSGLLLAGSVLLFCGIAIGYFEPQRFWRWAVASILPHPIIRIIHKRSVLA